MLSGRVWGGILVMLSTLIMHADDIQVKDYRGKSVWGISTDKVSPADYPEMAALKLPEKQKVLKITLVAPGATGETEGVQAGDVIISINGQRADTFNISNVSGSRGGKLEPGDKLKLKLLRKRDGKSSIVELDCALSRYLETEKAEYHEPAGAAEFATAQSEHLRSALPLIEREKWTADFQDLRQRLTNIDVYHDAYRLPIFSYLVRNPFKLEAVSRSVIARTKAAGDDPVKLADLSEYLLDFAPVTADVPELKFAGGDLDAHLDYIETILKRCGELNKQALCKLSKEDIAYITDNRGALLDSFIGYKMLTYDPDTDRVKRALQVLRLANRIDLAAIFMQARLAAKLTAPDFLKSLSAAAGTAADKPVVASRDTSYGKILIAGRGSNIHNKDYAVIYDLGGDDLYFNNQGGSVPGSIPTSVFVDFDGNDAYESTDTLSQGGGNLGVGMLVDLAGNDQYIGIRNVQGAAFGGVGILIDQAGADTYRGMTMAQGVGFFGAGVLVDKSGNDRYEAHQNAQAVGFVKGVGLLSDLAGDDSYYCKGSQQTGYKTRGHFEGWGQGMGFGIRPYASGGVGVLYDQTGRDRFEAGTFAQGGGYYYALGIFANSGNDDDFYIGTRYAQGFGVHQALGAFIEAGGNDVYRTRLAVAQGLAWDEAVGLFIDEAGDDSYNGGSSFSLGAAAHNAICMFLDRSGNDNYASPRAAVATNNSYHGGTSLTIFIDEGEGKDTYVKRSNNAVETGKANSIFIDR